MIDSVLPSLLKIIYCETDSPSSWSLKLKDGLWTAQWKRSGLPPISAEEILKIPIYPQIVWRRKNEQTFTIVLGDQNVPTLDSIPEITRWKTYPFTTSSNSQWDPLDRPQHFIPQWTWTLSQKETTLHITLIKEENDLISLFRKKLLNITPQHFNEDIPSIVDETNRPHWEQWQSTIGKFKNSSLDKVVLAVEKKFHYSHDLPLFTIIKKALQSHSSSFLAALLLSPIKAFITLSPERLYWRQDQECLFEAIAGTIIRGKDPNDDLMQQKKLLSSPKDRKEQEWVTHFIEQKLRDLQLRPVKEKAQLLSLSHLHHLQTHIKAQLGPHMTDEDLLTNLHPTPAVAGYPQEEALQFLLQNEPFTRGPYAGLIGFQNAKESEWIVGLRSMFIEGAKAFLYAGAGIVKESDPKQEWEEIHNKWKTALSLLSF